MVQNRCSGLCGAGTDGAVAAQPQRRASGSEVWGAAALKAGCLLFSCFPLAEKNIHFIKELYMPKGTPRRRSPAVLQAAQLLTAARSVNAERPVTLQSIVAFFRRRCKLFKCNVLLVAMHLRPYISASCDQY